MRAGKDAPSTDKQQAKVDMRKAAQSTVGHDVVCNYWQGGNKTRAE